MAVTFMPTSALGQPGDPNEVPPVESLAPQPTPDPGAAPIIQASAAILINLDNGQVLYARNIHNELPPASMTKVVTALVVRDSYSMDEIVTVPPEVVSVGGGKLGMEAGMQFTVDQLLNAMLIKSSNDAAFVLAAHDPAGYSHFIGLMNQKSRALGAYESNFVNPHGLDAADHLSSAWDMAIFGRQILKDPLLAQIVATPRYTLPWPDGTIRRFDNHNALLLRKPDETIGVKTGYTRQAGRCLIAAAKLGPGRALTVVMNSPDHYTETTELWNFFSRRPEVLQPADGPNDSEPVRLATPPLSRVSSPSAAQVLAAASQPPKATSRPHWAALMVLLAAMTVLTLQRPRKASALEEAAAFHPYLEPLLRAQNRARDKHA